MEKVCICKQKHQLYGSWIVTLSWYLNVIPDTLVIYNPFYPLHTLQIYTHVSPKATDLSNLESDESSLTDKKQPFWLSSDLLSKL